MKISLAILVLATAAFLKADDFASHFAVVMIDDETEAKLGSFPYDRAIIAKAVDACAHAGAKAVVLKFFYDQPKSEAGDAALCDAMTRIPVALQVRLENSEGRPLPIPARFRFSKAHLPTAVRGDLGWIPLSSLMDAAATIGFVDFDSPAIPLVEEYRGVGYRSLILCCLELAMDAQATAEPDRIRIGRGFLPVSSLNAFHADLGQLESIKVISFMQLLSGGVTESEIKNRVVVIGLDSAKTPTLETEHGRMKVHRFFIQCLAASYRAWRANQALEHNDPSCHAGCCAPVAPAGGVAHRTLAKNRRWTRNTQSTLSANISKVGARMIRRVFCR
jgi:hypothetical protein